MRYATHTVASSVSVGLAESNTRLTQRQSRLSYVPQRLMEEDRGFGAGL